MQHHVGSIACDVRPRTPHGDADVGLRERGRIVVAIAGHRDDMSLRLQTFDDAQLLVRSDPTEDRYGIEPIFEHEVRTLTKFLAAHVFRIIGHDTDFTTHSHRCHALVTGDHHDANTGLMTSGDRLGHLLPRRVHDPDQSEEDHAPLHIRDILDVDIVSNFSGAQGKNAQRARGIFEIDLGDPILMMPFNRNDLTILVDVGDRAHEGTECTLGEGPSFTVEFVNCCHTLTGAIEGIFAESRMASAEGIDGLLQLPTEYSAGGIGRITHRLPLTIDRMEIGILA